MERTTDGKLVKAILAGSQEAAAELFERYWTQVWRAAFVITGRRSMTDDVVQGAFYRAFRSLDRFDTRRPFHPWLHRIVINLALDAVRGERRFAPLGEANEPAVEWLDEAGRDRDVLHALARLSPERRAVIFLRYWLELTPSGIAEVLGLPVGTVSSRLSRALSQLRSALEVDHVG